MNDAVVKSPVELTHDQLVEIVSLVQEFLFLDPSTGCFDPDREWSGADLCQDIAEVLERFGLVPDSACEIPSRLDSGS